MKLFRVNPANDDQFMAWFEVLRRSEFKHDDGRGGWLPSEWRARVPPALLLRQDVLRPVAIGSLEVTRDDNLS